jgi:hypothetical protein
MPEAGRTTRLRISTAALAGEPTAREAASAIAASVIAAPDLPNAPPYTRLVMS